MVIVYSLNIEPRFTEQDDPDFELQWAVARLSRKANEPNVVLPRIELEDDLKTKSLTRADIEEIWKKRRNQIVPVQRRYVERIETQKKREMDERQRETDARVMESKKRKAEWLVAPATKKAREDKEARITKKINDAQEAYRRKQEKRTKENEEERQRVQQLIQDANIARAIKQSSNIVSYRAMKRKLGEDLETMLIEEELVCQEQNKRRATLGKPPIPPRSEFEFRKQFPSPITSIPAELTLDLEGLIKKAKIEYTKRQKIGGDSFKSAFQDLRDISTSTIRDWLLVTRNPHNPTLDVLRPSESDISREQKRIDKIYKGHPINKKEEAAISAHRKSGGNMPESLIRQRLEDLAEWRALFHSTSEKYIEDINTRCLQGEAFDAEEYAEALGFEDAEELRMYRQVEMIKKYYGRNLSGEIEEKDVPWRPIYRRDEKLARFRDMLLELRDWEAATTFITDGIKNGTLPWNEDTSGRHAEI